MRKFLFVFLFLFITKEAICQSYSRPSITPIFLKHNDGSLGLVDFADSVSIPDRFDYNYFGNNSISIPFPKVSPYVRVIDGISEQINQIREAAKSNISLLGDGRIKKLKDDLEIAEEKLRYDDSMRNVLIVNEIQKNKLPNKIIGSILIDPKLGYMTRDIIAKRGQYNASDAEYLQAINSELGEQEFKNIGKELLKNVYFIILDNQVQTSEALDKQNSQNLQLNVSGNSLLYQIDIDSIINTGQFNKLMFLKKDEQKLSDFQNFQFPLKLVSTQSLFGSVANYTVDAKSSGKALLMAAVSGSNAESAIKYIYKSEDQINKELAESVFSSVLAGYIKKYPAFQVKVSVFATKPIRAKIGKKESIGVDDLYKVTENLLQKDGQITDRKIGWVRVKKVADNRKNADGKTMPSVFYKVGSRKVEKGMKLKEHDETGTLFGIGYNPSENNIMSGLLISADQITHLAPGLRLGIGLGGFMPLESTKVYLDDIEDDTWKFKGTNIYAELTFQKIFQANRIELTPYLGGYYSALAIDKFYINNVEYKTVDFPDLKGLTSNSYGALGGFKLGLNLGRNLQLNFGYKVGFPIEKGKLKSDGADEITTGAGETIKVEFANPKTMTLGLRLFGI